MNNLGILRIALAAGLGLSLAGSAFSGSIGSDPQHGGHGGGGGGSRGGQSHPTGGSAFHANREVVRTRNFVPRAGQAPAEARRPALPAVSSSRVAVHPAPPNPRQVAGQRTFTRTAQGRRYDNGMVLRKGMTVTAAWQKRYFPHGHYHFPHYRSRWVAGQSWVSPFAFYFGFGVPYLDFDAGFYYPPSVSFIDMPVYNGDNWAGYANSADPNYLNDPNLDQEEPGLNNALGELNETFGNGDISGLVTLVDPNMRIAIYERGTYQYSMNANDFLDLTRDALGSTPTVSFTITYLHQRAPAAFSVDAQHVYKDASGATRTVYVSFALQDIGGQWTLTQIDTAPDVNQAP